MTTSGLLTGACRILQAAIFICVLWMPQSASAQWGNSIFGPPIPPAPIPSVPPPAINLAPPGGGAVSPPSNPPAAMTAPSGNAPAQGASAVSAGQVPLMLAARFGPEPPGITAGLLWRIYSDKPDQNGLFKLIKEEKAASPTLLLPPGGYVVHVSFGLASAVKPVQLRTEAVREIFEIKAGGLRVEGRVGDSRIPPSQVSFDIYKGSQFEPTDRRPIVQNVVTGDVVPLPEGTYYIVSNYGDANSVVRSDIRVQAGKLTDVTVNHRAAIVTLKLVSAPGGEALANTAWSVMTPSGDVIKESIGAFPRYILAEGDYRAIARNEGKVYERGFKVITGVDGEIEVMAR
ncbi:MAG TPA: hypothetical protein VFK79_15895 [Xanthobacteraceae bacterium]|nr:hypothetical protein [Xanthobacteraceae bacterium]